MKYVYKDNVIDALERLSDYEHQKITWFENDQGLMDSFGESFACLVDDTYIDVLFDAGEIVFDPETDRALQDLIDIIMAFDDRSYADDILIEMSEMYTIRAKAAHCLELVRNSTGAGRTVGYLKPGTPPPDDAEEPDA